MKTSYDYWWLPFVGFWLCCVTGLSFFMVIVLPFALIAFMLQEVGIEPTFVTVFVVPTLLAALGFILMGGCNWAKSVG
jgi:hypothetical protein